MRHRILLPALCIALLAAPVAAADLFFHLRVDERDGGTTRVRINVPVSLLEAALPLIPERHEIHGSHIEVNGREFHAAELREALAAVRKSAENTPVTVALDDENAVFYRKADVVFIDVTHSDGERGVIRMPFDLAEALVAGDGNEVDVRAAARVLIRRGEGELMTVMTDDAAVRMWVDTKPESR